MKVTESWNSSNSCLMFEVLYYVSFRFLASIPDFIIFTIFSFFGKAKGCALRYVPT